MHNDFGIGIDFTEQSLQGMQKNIDQNYRELLMRPVVYGIVTFEQCAEMIVEACLQLESTDAGVDTISSLANFFLLDDILESPPFTPGQKTQLKERVLAILRTKPEVVEGLLLIVLTNLGSDGWNDSLHCLSSLLLFCKDIDFQQTVHCKSFEEQLKHLLATQYLDGNMHRQNYKPTFDLLATYGLNFSSRTLDQFTHALAVHDYTGAKKYKIFGEILTPPVDFDACMLTFLASSQDDVTQKMQLCKI